MALLRVCFLAFVAVHVATSAQAASRGFLHVRNATQATRHAVANTSGQHTVASASGQHALLNASGRNSLPHTAVALQTTKEVRSKQEPGSDMALYRPWRVAHSRGAPDRDVESDSSLYGGAESSDDSGASNFEGRGDSESESDVALYGAERALYGAEAGSDAEQFGSHHHTENALVQAANATKIAAVNDKAKDGAEADNSTSMVTDDEDDAGESDDASPIEVETEFLPEGSGENDASVPEGVADSFIQVQSKQEPGSDLALDGNVGEDESDVALYRGADNTDADTFFESEGEGTDDASTADDASLLQSIDGQEPGSDMALYGNAGEDESDVALYGGADNIDEDTVFESEGAGTDDASTADDASL